jgi:hypothetical protein
MFTMVLRLLASDAVGQVNTDSQLEGVNMALLKRGVYARSLKAPALMTGAFS